MKQLLVLVLALLLTACTAVPAPAPTAMPLPTAVPPTAPPPQVMVVTVVVPATPQPLPPTPQPTPTSVPPTAAPLEPSPTAQAPAPSGGPIAIPDDLGGGFFSKISISGDAIKLRCEPSSVAFAATAMNPYIVTVHLYYRMEDRQGTYITEWKNRGEMKSDNNGNFTLTFNVLDIHPDLRYYEKAWFDFEFVGLNKMGDVVGRSQKINQQITYYKECE